MNIINKCIFFILLFLLTCTISSRALEVLPTSTGYSGARAICVDDNGNPTGLYFTEQFTTMYVGYSDNVWPMCNEQSRAYAQFYLNQLPTNAVFNSVIMNYTWTTGGKNDTYFNAYSVSLPYNGSSWDGQNIYDQYQYLTGILLTTNKQYIPKTFNGSSLDLALDNNGIKQMNELVMQNADHWRLAFQESYETHIDVPFVENSTYFSLSNISLRVQFERPPTLSSPPDGSLVTTLTPQLSWIPSNDLTLSNLRYRVEITIASDPNFVAAIYTSPALTLDSSSILVPSGLLSADVAYLWRIVLYNVQNSFFIPSAANLFIPFLPNMVPHSRCPIVITDSPNSYCYDDFIRLGSGWPVYINYACVNEGAPPLADFYMNLYLDGNLISSKLVNGLCYGCSAFFDFQYNFPAGNHELKLVCDAYNQIEESKESDNQYARSISVEDWTPPTVTITSPTSGTTYSSTSTPITLSGTASDNVGIATISWSNTATGGSGTCSGTMSWTCSGISLNSGTNNITITANDFYWTNSNTDTLEVTYTPQTYIVSYNANEATSGTVPAAQTKTQDVALTLATNSGNLGRTGYTFVGWNTAANGSGTDYAVGASYTANAAVTLYAKWTALPTYTITYNGNGNTSGTVPAAQTKTQDVALTLATNSGNLAKTGYTFVGWNTAANGSGTDYAVGASYTANAAVTLYAKWPTSGTVTDDTTGLMWQQGENEAMNWDSAGPFCASLPLAGHADWRLPTIDELQTLIDTGYYPTIDTNSFSNAQAGRYWCCFPG